MLPAEFSDAAVGGLPLFTGALALVFGVLVVGGDYAWGTWKTILVQQPSRGWAFAGKVAATAAGSFALVLSLLGVAAGSSLLVAGLESADLTWPPSWTCSVTSPPAG